MNEKQLRQVERMYLDPNVRSMQQTRRHSADEHTETMESYAQAHNLIHDDLDDILDSIDPTAIDMGISAYVDWLLGRVTTHTTVSIMRGVLEGASYLHMDNVANSYWRRLVKMGVDLNGVFVLCDNRTSRWFYVANSGLFVKHGPIPSPITVSRLLVWSFGPFLLQDLERVRIYRQGSERGLLHNVSIWDRAVNGDVILPRFGRRPAARQTAEKETDYHVKGS